MSSLQESRIAVLISAEAHGRAVKAVIQPAGHPAAFPEADS